MLDKLLILNADRSPKPDGLHPRVLKEVALEINEAFVKSFQCSIDSA